MQWNNRLKNCLPLLVLLLPLRGSLAQGQGVNVLTRNYNNQRTGANLSETALNVSNVAPSQFGKLFMLPVDDQIYAGVLYVAGLQIAGGTHNVIYVESMNNSVYAFDADSPGAPLWSRNFNGSGQPSSSADVGGNCSPYNDFRGDIGIVGTPVIDASAGTIYFVTRAVLNGTTIQSLHALNITNGEDQPNSPQVIQASVPGNGDGGTSVVFNPQMQNQRPALALSQGVVYIAWASYCDTPPFHGWVLAYNSTSLAQLAAFNVTPNGSEGGIWMAGAGPVFDTAGNIYYALGNGTSDGATDFGESMVHLAPNSLTIADYFTPSNFNSLNASDLDFGSSGPSILPGTTFLVSGGKEGKLYLLSTANLGQEANGDVQIPQVFQAVDLTVRPSATHHIHNASPSWNSPEGLNVYVWGENDFLHAFQFNTSTQTLNTTAYATGSVLPPQGMPGGMLTISASASQAGTGIVWASVPRNGDANQDTAPGNLYAFNAENLNLLYASTAAGDDLLNFSKGSAPIVANGKVYVGSLSKFVEVYGLKTSGVYSQDLALNQTATGSAPCTPAETPSQAVNGSFSGGLDDKWCSSAANPYLLVDLGSPQNISRFVVEHAGAGGEALSLNTAAFNIQISSDGVNFTTVVSVTGNVDSITTHDIAPTIARYVQLNIVSATLSGNPPASIYEFQVFGPATGGSSDFSLSEESTWQAVNAGGAVSYTALVGPLYRFSGTVTLSAGGLPPGAAASFSPASVSGSGSSTLSILTASSTPVGAYTVTITGVSGTLQHSGNVTLLVDEPSSSVNLAAAYNRIGILTDGSASSSTGLDQFGNGYSANLLGASVYFEGLSFTLGPANAPDVVTSATIPLPAGSYSTLAMLGTAINGSQTSQTFVVHYSDGTTSTFVQSLSDWGLPQNFAGESVAATMQYRDSVNGTQNFATFYLYGYSFALNSAKTATSITLPNNGNVAVLAITLSGGAPSAGFSLSAAPASQTVTVGGTANYTATLGALNGFTGTVTLSASGLPAGITASFNPASIVGAGTSAVSLQTTGSTPSGTYMVALTGTSGTLQQTSTVTLVVNAAGSGGGAVNLASAYNRSGIVTDGSVYTSGGLDGLGYAYSSNLLGSTVSFDGSSFTLGPANARDAVSSTTIPLPPGSYSTLAMLATAVNGNQPSQTFVVNYSDGSSSPFARSLSDWYTPQGYAGESEAVTMAYRDMSNGTQDNRTFYLYGYSFALNNAKTASSITLPSNSNVVVLAITLTGGTPAAGFSLSASPGSQTVTAGGTAAYTATVGALNGFTGTVALSAGGSPSGTTASFNPASIAGAGASALSLATSGSTPAGTYTVTLTGTSGTLQQSSTVTLVVNAAGSSVESVNLASLYNRSGIVTDGSTFTSGGLDLYGNAYSANLLGSLLTLGPANAPDAVTSTTIPLPAGSYSTLTLLGTAVNGNQPSQTFIVHYSDGSTSTFLQSLSDWYTPQNYAGESETMTMAYRDVYNGTEDHRTHYLYGYSFALNSAKTASSITLPNNENVVALAITLTGATAAPGFSLSVAPGSGTVTAGGTASYTATIGALNGFMGTVALSAGGLPSGTTASFNPASIVGAGTSTLSFATTGSTPAGTYTVTLTGTSGTLQQSGTVTLVVNAAASIGGPVSLAAVYNRSGIVTDGSTFTSGGLDLYGNAYSANLLGSSFTLGPANTPDAVTSTTIPLPAGSYSTLAMLGTAVNGNQPSQTFVVNYSDGSTSTFLQSLSDWYTPQNYAGESEALTMAYRDMSNGTEDHRTFYLYGYSFALNNAKTATSITLPNNGNVVVLGISVAP
jgi:F5/8 type C domain